MNQHKIILLIAVLCISVWARRTENNLSSQTMHFSFYYPKKLEKIAPKIAEIAESSYEKLSLRYPVEFKKPIDFIIKQDLYSNGYAIVQRGQMAIWVTDWGIDLRTTHAWLHDVIYHELAHLFTLQISAKWDTNFLGFGLQGHSYPWIKSSANIGVFYPMQQIPSWFAEGSAQYESSLAGFDSFDTHRQSILNAMTVENKTLSLNKMNGFWSEDILDFERGPYTQGFALTLFIHDKWGEKAVPKIWKSIGEGNSFASALKKVINLDEYQLMEQWENSLPKDLDLYMGNKISNSLIHKHLKIVGENHIAGVSNVKTHSWKSNLWIQPIDSLVKADTTFSLWEFDNHWDPQKPIWNHGFALSDSDSTGILYYVTKKYRDSLGNALADLAMYSPLTKKHTRLTDGEWTKNPALHPNGKELAYIRLIEEENVFELVRYSLDSNKVIQTRSNFQNLYHNLYNPTYSPSGLFLAYGVYDGQKKFFHMLNLQTQTTTKIQTNATTSRSGFWKGRQFCFSANIDNAKFEVFCVNPDSQKVQKANLKGISIVTAISQDSTWFFVDITSDGLVLKSQKNVSLSDTKLTLVTKKNTKVYHKESEYSLHTNQKKYQGIPSQWIYYPLLAIQEETKGFWGQGERVWKYLPSFVVMGSDPLDLNQLVFSYSHNWNSGWNLTDPKVESQLSAMWTNQQTPLDFSLMWTRQNSLGEDSLEQYGNPEDPKQVSKLSIGSQAVMLQGDYSWFKNGDYIRLFSAFVTSDYHFYDSFGDLEFNKGFLNGVHLGWSNLSQARRTSALAPLGFSVSSGYSLQKMDIFNPEQIEFDPQTGIQESYHKTQIQSASGMAYLGLPLWNELQALYRISGAKVLNWSGPAELNRFFEPSFILPGYFPYNNRDYAFHNLNILEQEFHLQFPIYKALWNRGGYLFRGLYGDLGAYAARGWKGSYWKQEFWDSKIWVRSLTAELRLSQVLWYSQPVEIFVQGAWGLDSEYARLGEGLYPHQWKMGISVSFVNPLAMQRSNLLALLP